MRELTVHRVNPANDKLKITVVDEPGAGGANHLYVIEGFSSGNNEALSFLSRLAGATPDVRLAVIFQNGPINDAGVNGVTQEALLAIVADRLRSFQSGPFACRENACALTKIEEAMHWLHSRTRARMQRGVEGTHTV